jgi:RNA polymerase sigma-70 factor (ECF subfamily)
VISDAAIEENIPRLRRYARALTGSREAADDLVQDTLERALSRARLFRPGASARPWLFSIMHNLFVNQVRSAAARRSAPSDGDPPEPVSHESAQDGLAVRDIARALERLPAEQREVLLLVALEDLSYRETASVVGVPVGTVMSRLARGRERLRQLLAGEVEPSPLKVVK